MSKPLDENGVRQLWGSIKDLVSNLRPIFPESDANTVGTILSFMGTTPPNDYLICDGSIISYDNYKRLGDFFEDQFGSRNYFGGTEDQFALPDLRNHFLRGYHGSAETLSGDIGVTQEATRHNQIWIRTGPAVATIVPDQILENSGPVEGDLVYNSRRYWTMYNQDTLSNFSSTAVVLSVERSSSPTASGFNSHYTSRPINTSVLFCIKYQDVQSSLESSLNQIRSDIEYISAMTGVDLS